MIRVTESLLAQRAYRLSLALVDDLNRTDQSSPELRYVTGVANPWRATVAARPPRVRGRWFQQRGETPFAALEQLVDDLRRECSARGLDAQQILRDAKLVDYV